jgi:hypothetical protein
LVPELGAKAFSAGMAHNIFMSPQKKIGLRARLMSTPREMGLPETAGFKKTAEFGP